MNNKQWSVKVLFILLFLIVAIVPLILFNSSNEQITVLKTQTDTIFVRDTFTIIKPHIKAVETLKIDTVITIKADTIKLITEQKKYVDTLSCNGDTAFIDASISGINANLDSINIQLLKTNWIKTNTIKDKKRFHISPQLGVGYGVFDKNVDLFIGVGISYDL